MCQLPRELAHWRESMEHLQQGLSCLNVKHFNGFKTPVHFNNPSGSPGSNWLNQSKEVFRATQADLRYLSFTLYLHNEVV